MNINYFDGKSSISYPASIVKDGDLFYLKTDDVFQQIISKSIIDESDNYYRIEIETDIVGVVTIDSSDSIYELRQLGFIPNRFFYSLSKPNKLIGLTASLILISVVLYMFGLSFFVDKIVDLIPKEAEIYLIEKTSNQFESNESIIKDDSTLIILDKCEQLLTDLNEITYPLDIKIVNSDVKNAFSLPGGKNIYL